MGRKYFDWDQLALIVTRTIDVDGTDTEVEYSYGFLGRANLYGLLRVGELEGGLGADAIAPVVGVRQWDTDDDGPFVPYAIEQLTASGLAQNYRISGGGKSALILVADDISSAALSASTGVIGKKATIGATVVDIESVSAVQKATISV